MTYREQIDHPKWQRRRLEIMRREDFKCMACGETNKGLHIHHLHYEKGLMIWEYDDESLVCVCKDCHKYLHDTLSKVSGLIAFKLLTGEITFDNFI